MIKRQANDGLHVMVEGIDGSGKSTVLKACREWAEERGATFFDVVSFMEQEQRLPNPADLGGANGLLCAEPTFCWIGRAIREEIIAKHLADSASGEIVEPRYSGWETAQAFALDRLVLFRRLIIPFLRNHPERIIFQDRGLGSSLAYQPLQDTSLSTERLLELPGNAQTVAFNPTLLLLIRTEAAAAMARLAQRTDKQDEVIFEEPDFQTKLVQRFLSDDVLGPFKQAGTMISEIDGNQNIEQVAKEVKSALSQKLDFFARMKA